MKLREARSILEIAEDATPEEVKKKYKAAAKRWHPDVNKSPDAEAKFKEINEAYQVISSGKSTDHEDMQYSNPFSGFNPFGRQKSYQADIINLNTTISFKDSVIGCQKTLKFNRKTKCKDCNGQGHITINNGCDKCGGRGQVVSQNGNMIFSQTCNKCYGRSQTNSCSHCNQKGVVDAEVSITVSVPGGVINNNVLRLGGMGNFIGNFGPIEQHTDAHLHITVTADPNLTLDGTTVISNISISLLEALQGCKKTVNTIMGDKEIEISPKSRNKDIITLPKLGVNRSGDQNIILDVQYPDDINNLIATLKE